MKKESLLAFLLGSIITCLLNATPVSNDAELYHLYALASKNLNYSSSVPDECIIELCTKELVMPEITTICSVFN